MKTLLFQIFVIFFFSRSVCHGEASLRIPLGVNLQTLDQTEAEDFVTIRVLLNLGEGLTRLDKKLNAIPGLAKDWSISKDEKTYTFNLKNNFWSDGKPIKAKDFLRAFEHTFSPSTSARIGAPLLEVVSGAQDFKAKKTQDFNGVGVKVIGENKLQITLTHPAAYFLKLLSLPLCFPLYDLKHSRIVPNDPTSGSYYLESMKNGKIVLAPNPHSLEKAKNHLEFIFIKEESSSLALYEKGEVDLIDRIPSQDFVRFKDNQLLKTAPWLATYYIGFNQTKKPFNDVNARRAFVSAVNRDDIIQVLRDPQKSTSSFVPAPLTSSEFQYGPPLDAAKAKKQWAEVSDVQRLDFFFDNQEKNNLIASRLQNILKANLNLDLNLRGMEWKSYLQYLKSSSPLLFRFAWLAAFPDPLSHLGVFTADNPNNYTGYKNSEYDDMVQKIARLAPGAKRDELIKKAQQKLLTTDVVIMPLFNYVQYLLMPQHWQGLEVTPMGVVYFHQAVQKPAL